jgi:hypothetical protein
VKTSNQKCSSFPFCNLWHHMPYNSILHRSGQLLALAGEEPSRAGGRAYYAREVSSRGLPLSLHKGLIPSPPFENLTGQKLNINYIPSAHLP